MTGIVDLILIIIDEVPTTDIITAITHTIFNSYISHLTLMLAFILLKYQASIDESLG